MPGPHRGARWGRDRPAAAVGGPSRLSLRMKLAAASLAAGLLVLGLWLPHSRSLRGARGH